MNEIIGTKNSPQHLKGVLNENVIVIFQGEQAKIQSMSIDSNGELIVVLDSGTSVSLGVVKGDKGDIGEAAGFGSPTSSVVGLESGVQPTISVTASGDNTAKIFDFSFGIPKGDKGDPGVVFTPSIDVDGNVSWTNNGDLSNPQTVNVKGRQGDRGERGYYVYSIYKKSGTGMSGTTDVYGVIINDDDNTEVGTFSVYNGADGEGVGDMTMVAYDTNGDGVVNKADDADSLGGYSASYYAKTTDIPIVPTDISAFNNDAGYVTANAIPTNIGSFENDVGYITIDDIPEVPTKISTLENDANFANTEYVDTKCAGIVNSAPETLNTLKELATALGNDPNYATTTATLIGQKVPQTRTINNKALLNDITLTAEDIGAAEASHGTHVSYSTTAPKSNGTASVGSATTVSRGDHVHPSDSTKVTVPATATSFPSSGTLVDNTIYNVSSAVSGTKTLTAPNPGWVHGTFTTHSSTAFSITYGSGATFLGEKPSFKTGTKYEFDVLNNVWVFTKVVSS